MLNEKTKRILMIIIFIIFVCLIAFLLYFVFFRSIQEKIQTPNQPAIGPTTNLPSTQESTPSEEVPTTEEPIGLPDIGISEIPTATPTAEGGVTQTEQLTNDETIKDITLRADGSELAFYNEDDGKFYRIDKNGNRQALSDKIFHNVDSVSWSPNSREAILEYPDGSNIYFDFTTQKQVTLPSNWTEFEFNQSSSQIAFKEVSDNPDFSWLSVANPDGSNKHSIKHLGINADKTTVSYSPSNQVLAYYLEPSGTEQKAFFVGPNDENYKAALIDGYGVETQWTPNGDKLLYSAYSDKTDYVPELWIIDAQGDTIGRNRINLGLNTSASKCTMSNQTTVYCAVPQTNTFGSGLEPSIDSDIADDIYKIDLQTGSKIKVAETDINANIKQLIVDKNQDTLFFVENGSDNLYKMEL